MSIDYQELLQEVKNLKPTAHHILSFEPESNKSILTDDIYYIESTQDKIVFITAQFSYYSKRWTIGAVEEFLKDNKNFIRTHKSFIVNMDKVFAITKAPEGFQLKLKTPIEFSPPLTDFYSNSIKEYFELPALDHVVPYDRIAKILAEENIRDFKEDIRFMSVEQLKKDFSAPSGEINVTNLIENIVWQVYTQIEKGTLPKYEGNIRSFWYSHIKPVLSRLNLLTAEGNHYITEILVFTSLISEHNLFKYSQFGFYDERNPYKIIGSANSHTILFAEKRGFFYTLQQISKKSGITAIALGGEPSHLSSEYFVEELSEQAPIETTEFVLFSVCDYDPSGYYIISNFLSHLKRHKLNIKYMEDLITPTNFTPKEIEFSKYKLEASTTGEQTQIDNWIKQTGGINGEPYGLESDAMSRPKLRDLFEQKVKPFMK